ncbi:MAG: glycoside hydrolase family 5 protein [Planctomycetes bacterium]|nr:glycoside hydrolase family 5 protein [Planctomycetota bacterium]
MISSLRRSLHPDIVSLGRLILVLIAIQSRGAAAEPSAGSLTLVDFENADAVRLVDNQASGSLKESIHRPETGVVLEVVTEATADYPSVRIEPTAGPWNLSGYENVTATVQNLDDAPLRVLLCVNNPGADGLHGCSVASLALGPQESGVLTVWLGLWHGEARPLDLAQITSLEVLLDKPGRGHRFLIDDIQAARRETFDLAKALADPDFLRNASPLGRGINLGNALEAPNEGEWGVTLEEAYFREIKAAGFDSIRLPVRWSAHAAGAAPYTIESQFFARVDWALDQAEKYALQIVLNVHHYEEMDSRPDEHWARFLGLWTQIAERYQTRPAGVKFELLNEPHDQLTAGKWNELLREALAVVRKTNPTRTVVVGPTAWNSIDELKSLDLPADDRNLVVTVHYYNPFEFTHQAAPWLDAASRPPAGRKWTGTDAERAAVTRDLDTAALWGLKNRRPIYLGEFGVLDTADLASRAAWTKFVAHEAARRRLGTAYWEFCSGFGAYDPVARRWLEPLRNALVPTQAP